MFGNIYNCPLTNICTSNYAFCPYIAQNCSYNQPFICFNGNCVSNPDSQCCGASQIWCPHTNKCVTSANDCCTLNTTTPIFCNLTKTCVSFEYQCCSNFKSYVGSNSMVKCSYENKCVPSDTSDYCFTPYKQTCTGDYPFQCQNDGKCVSDISLCASTRVCPAGYYTCPNYTCIPGLAKSPLCNPLQICKNSTNLKGRCSDGVTCTEELQFCPTQVTCSAGLVLCPDNTCVKNQQMCVQPPKQSYPKLGSCGPTLIRCPNGECSQICSQLQSNCLLKQMVQCPGTFECATNYDICPNAVYCPLVNNYTFSFKSIICDSGPQICTWDISRCKQASCASPINYFQLPSVVQPWQKYSPYLLKQCQDGRCSQFGCMTQISCSNNFSIKIQMLGYLCTNQTSDADNLAQIAYKLQAFSCPSNMITCLSGHCRKTVYDCPQFVTCPKNMPIMCQDGYCTTSKDNCQVQDDYIAVSYLNCQKQGYLMCNSGLICVRSIEQCPTMSTCPFGTIKCAENLCVFNQSCPDNIQRNITNPIYCRSLNTVVQSTASCPLLTVCSINKPVKCASDQSCQESISMCPPFQNVQVFVKIQNLTGGNVIQICNQPNFYLCLNGSCANQCSEWFQCPFENQHQCFDGRCVSDFSMCPNQTNGCPFNLPVFCPYQAQCVQNTSLCKNQTTAHSNLNKTCQTNFGSNYTGCPLGNCVQFNKLTLSAQIACQNFTIFKQQCLYSQFPNDLQNPQMCFVFQCPKKIPFKCQNGLCVSDLKYCPIIQFNSFQLNNCSSISISTGLNLKYPCGNGDCVSSPDQCMPLYDCSYNLNGLIVRCNDGTCKSLKSECNQRLQTNCVFRCNNGQCVDNSSYCLLENGCLTILPYRCENNGICMQNSSSCLSTTDILQKTALFPKYKTLNICESKGLITCISDSIMYCAANLSRCYSIESGCPVDSPILCGGWCVKSISDCSHVTQPSINNQGCTQTQPFRCSNLQAVSCAELPFTNDPNLFSKSCSAVTQSFVGKYPINKCSSALRPYSCADGQCVQNKGECRSCSFFCNQLMGCTATEDECIQYGILKANNQEQASLYQQICPIGTPIRCVVNGLCTNNVADCLKQLSQAYSYAFVSSLLDSNCPYNQPIRCIDGQCVIRSLFCMKSIQMNSTQMKVPISWSATSSFQNKYCQVYCADGSCRDRQQSCALAQACNSPLKRFRCMNGLCAASLNECIDLFGGDTENESRNGTSAFCMKIFGTQYSNTTDLVKCEDGTCRPAVFNKTSNQYQTSCLSYLGCPLSNGYQCPTGHCVTSQVDCLIFSNSAICKSLYMCKNMACVSDPALCGIDLSSLQVQQLSVDLSPHSDMTINIAYNGTLPTASITIPSINLALDVSLTYDMLKKIIINPVPNQRQYSTPITADAFNYTNQRYKLFNSILSSTDSLLGPLVDINIAQQWLSQNITIQYKLDLPTAFDLKSDVCLAQVQTDGKILSCISRNFKILSDGWISFSFQLLTQSPLGVIFCPDMSLKTQSIPPFVPTQPPDPVPPQPIPEPVNDICKHKNWCKYKWYIVGGSVGLFLLLVLLITLFTLCKRPNQQQPIIQKKEESLQNEKEVILIKQLDEAQEQLRYREQKINELKQTMKEVEQSKKSGTFTNQDDLQSQYTTELKLAEERIKDHYRSEVLRVAVKLQKESESQGLTPTRLFVRPATKKLELKEYKSVESQFAVYKGPNKHKMDTQKSDQQLTDQWNILVHEYKPPNELMSQTSRPYLTNPSLESPKSTNVLEAEANQLDTESYSKSIKVQEMEIKNTDSSYKPRKVKIQQDALPYQSANVKRNKKLF